MINLKNKKIGVLCGGTSSERDISLMSGKAVFAAIKRLGLKTVLIDVNKNVAEKLKKEKIDIACIMLHGTPGEDGTIQGLLEVMGIPYTGCGVFSSSASIDKIVSKKMFEYAKIPTAKWTVVEKMKPFDEIAFPVVVKPASQGSAIGVSIVKSKKEFEKAVKLAFSYEDRILVEKYVKGIEVTAGVLNGKSLPVIEIVPKGKFYDFKSKYTVGQSTHVIPARLPKTVLKRIQNIALKVYEEFRCNGTCRVDMIVDKNNKIYVLELNTLPGMTKTSLFPDAAKHIGMNFDDLVLEILKSAK
jgi:D-alanine-D-alanine ligase